MHIRDNVFIVSGGASGLGAAAVRMLVEEGGRVIVADLQQEAAQALIEDCGPAARYVPCDVTSELDAHAVAQAAQEDGPLRGLVNCAGVLAAERIVGRDHPHLLETFERVIRVNLIGTFNMTRVCAQAMAHGAPADDGERGVIVNTASTAAFEGQLGQAAYTASKGGVVSLTVQLARELGRQGIRVMAIAPGPQDTPMLGLLREDIRAALEAQIPFPSRLGRPEEFAALVRHIVENPYLNGETIRLDGSLRMPPR